MEILNNPKSNITRGVFAVLIFLSAYLAAQVITEVKSYRFIGGGAPAANTISFSGQGEVFAAPDIALINLTIREEAKDTTEAQSKATAKEKSVLNFLAKQGIEKKDIKTENYNTYPKYDYGSPCYDGYCPRQAPKIIGYEVSEYISIKVRKLDKAGELVGGLGGLKIAEINGPNFSIENEDELKAAARKMAIDEAKAKAEVLAADLGVRLVRIVNFSEGGDYPMPVYGMGFDAKLERAAGQSIPPELPVGENKITSSVTITYEIR